MSIDDANTSSSMLPLDTVDHVVKKSKKLKKEKTQAQANGWGSAAVDSMDVEVKTSAQSSGERTEKRDKKKKRKHLEHAGVEGNEETLKTEKKKRKREQTEDETLVKDGATAGIHVSQEGEKKKKRKDSREDGMDVNEMPVEASEASKNQKHKDVLEGDGMPTSAPSSSTQKKCKREKKDKSKRLDTSTLSDSTLTASSAATSAVPTPLSTTRAPTPTAPTPADVSAYLKAHNITIHTPSSSTAVVPMLSFSQLDEHIPQALRDALKSFKEPTPIQACAWPTTLRGDDVVGIAETGSGKTLAFGIPAIARIAPSTPQCVSQNSKKSKGKSTTTASISALVIAPTRELAIQTHDTMTMLGEPFGLRSIAVFGGVDKEPQKRALREAGAAVVVGTPGRIMDLMDEGVCDLSRVTYLVLDEADRMLDKGFENDIRKIMKGCAPVEQRQTLMFSATWPEAVRRLAATFQRNPIRITVGSDDLTANSRVEQTVEVFDDQREKDSRLTAHLRALQHKKTSLTGSDEKRILVFALYKKEASRVEQTLRRAGYAVGSIHGDLSQAARMESLEAFKSGKTGLLVATDVASRGLDIPNVGTVINYTFPLTVEDYIHRIGRTGRGGKSGKAITFFTGDGHERGLAGELAKILRDGGFDAEPLKKFPMTIKKKEHGAYGAFYKDTSGAAAPKRLKFT